MRLLKIFCFSLLFSAGLYGVGFPQAIAKAMAQDAREATAPVLTQEKLFAQLGQAHAQIAIDLEYIQALIVERDKLKEENAKLKEQLTKAKPPISPPVCGN